MGPRLRDSGNLVLYLERQSRWKIRFNGPLIAGILLLWGDGAGPAGILGRGMVQFPRHVRHCTVPAVHRGPLRARIAQVGGSAGLLLRGKISLDGFQF